MADGNTSCGFDVMNMECLRGAGTQNIWLCGDVIHRQMFFRLGWEDLTREKLE